MCTFSIDQGEIEEFSQNVCIFNWQLLSLLWPVFTDFILWWAHAERRGELGAEAHS